MLTPVAWRMQMPNNRAKPDADARPNHSPSARLRGEVIQNGGSGISLQGRPIIAAMCLGQLGSLLPHVVVPSILAAFLIPEWHLAARNQHSSIFTPIVVSVVFSLLAMPASIFGNELALRFGRHRAISAVMFSSAVVALLIGVFADKS